MSNGYFSIQGYQVGTPLVGRIDLGPFNIPFSAVSAVVELGLSAGTLTLPVPAFSAGAAIIPPIGSPPEDVTLKVKTVSGDSGIFVSTEYPTILKFDTVNNEVPTNLYLVTSDSITVAVQFL